MDLVDFAEHLGGELNLVMHGAKKKNLGSGNPTSQKAYIKHFTYT